SQSYYYIVVRDHKILEKIVEHRGPAGEPILEAPLAIAVCASSEVSRRYVQDACIAAYHLLLAAYAHGLGTCWVTDMDNDTVKGLLDVPQDDYIACLTPLGWPAEHLDVPARHEVGKFVHFL
ncbi:MAG: nitroreductase family protein, partial [Candidatus Syntrophosphaera sp.]